MTYLIAFLLILLLYGFKLSFYSKTIFILTYFLQQGHAYCHKDTPPNSASPGPSIFKPPHEFINLLDFAAKHGCGWSCVSSVEYWHLGFNREN